MNDFMDKKTLSLLLLQFLCLFSVNKSSYAADAECQLFANETADELIILVDEQVNDFEKDLAQLKHKYLSKKVNSRSEWFEIFVSKQKEQFKYNAAIASLRETLPPVLRRISESETDRQYCDDHNALTNLIESRVDNLERMLELLLEGVEQRIELEELDKDEGLAIIAAYAYGYAEKINLKSNEWGGDNISIGPLDNSQSYKVVKLKKGRYYWGKVTEKVGYGSYKYYDFSDKNLSFDVEPGKLNLTGVLIFERKGERASADISDRSAIVMKMLEDSYPLLVDKYELHNALAPADPFPAFYKQQKTRLKQEMQ
jgi:hypothetical protein